ncbi:MAG: hypothetical protein HY801_01255 [Candidatus Lindowbacteria bacterium]|nr:hypothetical protein [Candidatus Lindowbacteria bacterium]
MEALHHACGLTRPETGRLFGGLDYSSVSVNRKKFLLSAELDFGLKAKLEAIVRETIQ